MIIVSGSTTNNIEFYSRYNRIDKWEVIDQQSKLITTGSTSWVGSNGLIQLTGFTYQFKKDNSYTLKTYFLDQGLYYLTYQGLIRCFSDDERLTENYTLPITREYKYKNKQ